MYTCIFAFMHTSIIHMCMHAPMPTYICAYLSIHAYIKHTYIRKSTHACKYVYIHDWIYVCIHTHMYAFKHADMHAFIHKKNEHIHTYIHTYIHISIYTYIHVLCARIYCNLHIHYRAATSWVLWSFAGHLGEQRFLVGYSGELLISGAQKALISTWLALWASLELYTAGDCLNLVVTYGHKNGRITIS